MDTLYFTVRSDYENCKVNLYVSRNEKELHCDKPADCLATSWTLTHENWNDVYNRVQREREYLINDLKAIEVF